jgi:hypothetical protein
MLIEFDCALDWSFQILFDRTIDAACPVSSWSTARVVVSNDDGYTLSPELPMGDESVAMYDLASRKDSSGSWWSFGALRSLASFRSSA